MLTAATTSVLSIYYVFFFSRCHQVKWPLFYRRSYFFCHYTFVFIFYFVAFNGVFVQLRLHCKCLRSICNSFFPSANWMSPVKGYWYCSSCCWACFLLAEMQWQNTYRTNCCCCWYEFANFVSHVQIYICDDISEKSALQVMTF